MAPSSRTPSPTPSALPPIPSSPTYSYASTAFPTSTYNLPLPPPPRSAHAVLTKSDLEASQAAYSELLSTAKAYRLSLASLSSTASAFGAALENCARLKEARSEALHPPGGSLSNSFTAKGSCTADSLLAASGVHQLVANHQQILSECVYRNFEVPLLHDLDQWRRHMEEEELTYQREAKIQSKEIRRMEKEGLKLHKQRKRDVAKFRGHLVDLTTRLDGLTTLHGTHSRGLLREAQEMSLKIVDAGAGLVRAEVDIFEALARKGWSGGGLDDLLEKGRDIFANDGESTPGGHHEGNGSKIFSILPQKSILHESDGGGPALGHARNNSLGADVDRYQSLAGAVSGPDDTGSIFSESGILNRSRGVRPFSPPPMERSLVRSSEDAQSATTIVKLPSPAEGDEEGYNARKVESAMEGDEVGTPSIDSRDSRGRDRRWSATDDSSSD
ncbi:phospholipid-binding protein [Phlyctema vagabunda]|uniref:Phospholipid-binding protein n=1 Tax=Phlyctema vagabunda TaxID=108571 RepID=A0ABR4PQ55_9HELO